MKAIVVSKFGDASVLTYQECELPKVEKNQVKVQLYAAGANPVDTYIRSGNYAMGLPTLPYTPGTDGAGKVLEVGEEVLNVEVGQRVLVGGIAADYCSGTYAQEVVCDAKAVCPLANNITFAQGASVGTPGIAAYYGLFTRGKLVAGEKVLVHGATGGVGILAVQLAKQVGAEVYATAGTAEGEALLYSLGVKHVFNHHSDTVSEEIVKATGGTGVDLILEMLADKNLETDFEFLALFGRIVIVGSRGSLQFTPRNIMTKEADIRGMTLGNVKKEFLALELNNLADELASGISPIVAEEIPLEKASFAHERVIQKSASVGKIILRIKAED